MEINTLSYIAAVVTWACAWRTTTRRSLRKNADDQEYVEALLSDEDTMRKLTPNGMDVVFEYVGIDLEAHRPKEIPAMTIREKFNKMIEKGIEKGRAEGIEEGRSQEKISFIQNLLNNGKTPEEISNFCGFSMEEIKTAKTAGLVNV